ncbi:hypothetical protein FOCG_01788 [Fusarium oxysporum f. sp. radicis-lycopersici 26381]|nr:hypothetical protein FOCG_01788 [Fusarium oxysporum f. sp. radicis-lycopersici 26381]
MQHHNEGDKPEPAMASRKVTPTPVSEPVPTVLPSDVVLSDTIPPALLSESVQSKSPATEPTPTILPSDTIQPESPTKPASTEPTSTEPTLTEPSSAEPSSAEPTSTEPASTEPEPTSAEPTSTEPASTEPASTEPASTEPTSTEPTSAEPTSAEPTSTEPTPILSPSDTTIPTLPSTESPVESTSIESIPSSTLPPESPIGSTRTGTTPTESEPTPTTSIPPKSIPPESTSPESTLTEPTPTAPTLPESLPSESTPPESIPPGSTASETPSIQATNEPPQITEGRTSPPESPQEPTKAASETIGSPDVTQPGITDQGTAIRPTSTSSPAGEIDLQDAVLGPNARFILIGGEPAMYVHPTAALHLLYTEICPSLLTAPPNGEASFSLNISLPPNITPGELVNLLASIRVESNGTSMPRDRSLFKREMTGSRLRMILDEKSIYDKELETTGGKFQEVKSEKTSISDQPSIKMVQRSGSNPVALTVRGLSLVKAEKQTAPSEKQTAPAEKQTAPAEKQTASVEKQTAPAEKQTAQSEKQTAPAEKQTAPVEKPTIPSEKSTIPVERPTVSEEEPTIPAEVTQTEAAKQTARSSGGSKTGGGFENFRPRMHYLLTLSRDADPNSAEYKAG